MADSIRVSLPTSGDENEAMSSTPGGAGGAQHRPQKRRRIPVACGACRSKKSRVSLAWCESASGLLWKDMLLGWSIY